MLFDCSDDARLVMDTLNSDEDSDDEQPAKRTRFLDENENSENKEAQEPSKFRVRMGWLGGGPVQRQGMG